MVIKISSNQKTVWQEQEGNYKKAAIRQRDFISAQVTACFFRILGQKQMLGGFFAVVINKSETHCRAPDWEDS